MDSLSDAKREALTQLCDAWVLLASATLRLNGYRVAERDDASAIALLNATLDLFREGCLHGPASFRSVVALAALEDLIFSTRGFDPFVDMTTGSSLVRATGITLTRAAALELIRAETAHWEDVHAGKLVRDGAEEKSA